MELTLSLKRLRCIMLLMSLTWPLYGDRMAPDSASPAAISISKALHAAAKHCINEDVQKSIKGQTSVEERGTGSYIMHTAKLDGNPRCRCGNEGATGG